MASMFDNVTISFQLANGSLNNCYLKGGASSHSASFYAVTLSAAVIVAIFSPVAAVGNALIIAVIWKSQSLRTPSYILLCCLAFTDLCTGLITQPFLVTADLICLKYPQALEKQLTVLISRSIVEGSASFFTTSTVILITLMSVERWLHMTRRSLLTVHRTFIIVTTLSILVIPVVVLRLLYFLNGNYETFYHSSSFVSLLVCLLITSIAYFKVYQVIHRHRQRIKESEQGSTFGRPAIDLAKYKKTVLTVLYILLVFYISYLPSIVMLGFYLFSYDKSVLKPLYRIFIMFWLLSSSLNPLIYLWRMNEIRNGVKLLLRQLFNKKK